MLTSRQENKKRLFTTMQIADAEYILSILSHNTPLFRHVAFRLGWTGNNGWSIAFQTAFEQGMAAAAAAFPRHLPPHFPETFDFAEKKGEDGGIGGIGIGGIGIGNDDDADDPIATSDEDEYDDDEDTEYGPRHKRRRHRCSDQQQGQEKKKYPRLHIMGLSAAEESLSAVEETLSKPQTKQGVPPACCAGFKKFQRQAPRGNETMEDVLEDMKRVIDSCKNFTEQQAEEARLVADELQKERNDSVYSERGLKAALTLRLRKDHLEFVQFWSYIRPYVLASPILCCTVENWRLDYLSL